MQYEEIEDIADIAAAHRKLSAALKRALPFRENRRIGSPAGTFEDTVSFRTKVGEDVFWWSGGESEDRPVLLNLFGHGTPTQHSPLFIDLQFNFPRDVFNRRYGGALIRGVRSGRVALAHRGIVTRGKSRVQRDLLLEEADLELEEVLSSAVGGISELLPVAFLDDPKIDARIAKFCIEVRRAAEIVADSGKSSKSSSESDVSRQRGELSESLSDYFKEFVGVASFRGSRKVRIVNFVHGEVVQALKENFGNTFLFKKSAKIDLVAVKSGKCFVCEVKTSATWQSLYTAIGQLHVHAAAVRRLYPKHQVLMVLVAPIDPAAAVRRRLLSDLGCYVIPFLPTDSTYAMPDLFPLRNR